MRVLKSLKTKNKAILALALALILTLSILPAFPIAGAVGEESAPVYTNADQIVEKGGWLYYDATGDEANAENFAVATSKTIAATGTENMFDITLQVKTTATEAEIKRPANAFVVVLIDTSASMSSDDLANARIAAKSFVGTFAGSASNTAAKRYVSIVSYDTHARVRQNWIDVSNDTGLNTARVEIDKLTTTASGTFMQGGLMLARNLYNTSNMSDAVLSDYQATPARNRFVVNLTDGNPNCYINTTSSTALTDVASPGAYSYGMWIPNNIGGGGAAQTDAGFSAARGPTATMAGAVQALATVYTIAYNTQDMDPLGGFTPHQWLAANVASNQSYALESGQSAEELELEFVAIADTINFAITPWKVNDPMAPGVNFISGAQGPAITQPDATSRTLVWDLTKTSPVRQTGTTERKVFEYEYTYRIKIDNINHAFSDPQPTNDETTLTFWINVNEDVETVNFTIPKVKAFAGNLTFYKEGSDVRRLNGYEFVLISSCGSYRETATSVRFKGRDGVVKFSGIPSGHTYTLTEITATNPYSALYNTSSESYHVEVSYGVLDGGPTGGIFVNQLKDIRIPLHKFFINLDRTFEYAEGEFIGIRHLDCTETEYEHGDGCYKLDCDKEWDVEPIAGVDGFEGREHVCDDDNCFVDGESKFDEETEEYVLGERVKVCELVWDDDPVEATLPEDGVPHAKCNEDCNRELICDKPEYTHSDSCYIDILSESYTFVFTLKGTDGNGHTDVISLTLSKAQILELMESENGKFEGSFTIPAANFGNGIFTVEERIESGRSTGWTLAAERTIYLNKLTNVVHAVEMENSYGDLRRPYFTVQKNLEGDFDENFTFFLTDNNVPVREITIKGSGSAMVRLDEYVNANAILKLIEVNNGTPYMQYDPTEYVIVIEDGEVVSINGNGGAPAVFNNTYHTPKLPEFSVSKTTNGPDYNGTFTFAYSAVGSIWNGTWNGFAESSRQDVTDSDTVQITTNGGSGSTVVPLNLPNFTGTVTVTEIAGGGTGNGTWSYSPAVFTLEFVDGVFQSESSTVDAPAASFQNVFTPTPPPVTPPPSGGGSYEEITFPEVPLAELPVENVEEELEELDFPEVPLAEFPAEEELEFPEVPLAEFPNEEELVDLDLPEIPLAEMPKTGVRNVLGFLLLGIGLSLTGIAATAAVLVYGRKKD